MTDASEDVVRVFNMHFPREAVSDPIIYNVGQMFNVVTVIRAAMMHNKECLMALELRGKASEVQKAVQYFKDHNVKVEPLPHGSED